VPHAHVRPISKYLLMSLFLTVIGSILVYYNGLYLDPDFFKEWVSITSHELDQVHDLTVDIFIACIYTF
jgi:membrane protein DedA with SNARE-associated domain